MENIPPFLIPVAIIVGSIVVGFILRWITATWLQRLARKTPFVYDDIVFACVKRPVVLASFLGGVWIVVRRTPEITDAIPYAITILQAALMVVLTVTMVRIARKVIEAQAEGRADRRGATGLIQKIVQVVILAIGATLILSAFGVSITALVTALGVGGLAVALALQDTLSNLFAGIYIILANQIRIGDYIQIGTEVEGYVSDINWRTTTIRQFDANMVIYPNSKLSQAVVTNLNLPEDMLRARIDVGVDYNSDPDHVERTLRDLILAAGHDDPVAAVAESQPEGKLRGLLIDPEPTIRFQRFDDSSLAFALFFTITSLDFKFSARHELMKRVLLKFRAEGISIPFPIRTLEFRTGGVQVELGHSDGRAIQE